MVKKKTAKVKRCWQCKRALVKGQCPKGCGPESLGKLLSFFHNPDWSRG